MEIQNKRIPDAEFEAQRQEVLTQWPTGKDVNLEEAIAYHKAMPEYRSFSKKLVAAKKEGRTLVQPRAGVPVIEEHIVEKLTTENTADAQSMLDQQRELARKQEQERRRREAVSRGALLGTAGKRSTPGGVEKGDP